MRHAPQFGFIFFFGSERMNKIGALNADVNIIPENCAKYWSMVIIVQRVKSKLEIVLVLESTSSTP
jgi:hypothetical protein